MCGATSEMLNKPHHHIQQQAVVFEFLTTRSKLGRFMLCNLPLAFQSREASHVMLTL